MQTHLREAICPIFDGSPVVCGSSGHHHLWSERHPLQERARTAAANLTKDKLVIACPTVRFLIAGC